MSTEPALMTLTEVARAIAMKQLSSHEVTRALLAAMPSSDPDRRTEKPPISGDPPTPIDPPSGCRFHTRCAFAEPLCANAAPKLTAVDKIGHEAACYMAIPGSGHSRSPQEETA